MPFRLLLLVGAILIALGVLALWLPAIAGSLVGAGVGAVVSVTIWSTTRAQARRQTALELFKEYYSNEFGASRHSAAGFMQRHAGVDWSRNDPYVLGTNDPGLNGYSAVLRYWQRVETLYREGELDRRLTQRLLSRELGTWTVRIIEPMAGRQGMYVRDGIARLAKTFEKGAGRKEFEEGRAMARRVRPPELDHPPVDTDDELLAMSGKTPDLGEN